MELKANLVELGTRLRPHWGPLAVVTVFLLAGILGVAPSYGDAQTAADGAAFQRIVSDDAVGRYLLAVGLDVLFATGYGLLALIAVSKLSSWTGRGVGVARFGCWLVFAGAVFDQLENVFVLVNVANRDGVDNWAVDVMTGIGYVKWRAALLGLLLLLGGLAVHGMWPSLTRAEVFKWLAKVWKPYLLYLVLVFLVVGLGLIAPTGWRIAGGGLLVAGLMGVGLRIDRLVDASREVESTDVDLGPARLALAFAQLALGVALFVWGVRDEADSQTTVVPGSGAVIVIRDFALVFGIVLVIMSLGALISELRQNTRFESRRSWVLFIAAGLLMAAGAIVGMSVLMLIVVGVAVLLGEVATELAAADRRRGRPADGPWIKRVIALGVVLALGGLVLWGMGADPVHASVVVAVLLFLVVSALRDGDALLVAALVGVLVLVATSPYEDEVEESLLPEPGKPYILVLGDSYASGEGAQKYLPATNDVVAGPASETSVNECRRAPTAWGFEVARLAADAPINEEFPTSVLFLACSGAVSENIDTNPRVSGPYDKDPGTIHGPAQLLLYEQLVVSEELDQPSLVIVGIGGNDAGFGDLGLTCVGPGNCAQVAEQFLENRPDRLINPPEHGHSEALVDIGDDLDKAFSNIERVVGKGVPIVAVSYPEPAHTKTQRCPGTLLSAEEREFINGFAMQLNEQVRAASRRAGISFMNISNVLANGGSQLCADSTTPGLNFLAFGSKGGTLQHSLNPKNWLHNSLHPTAEGHALFAKAAYDWFDEHWPLQSPVLDSVEAPTVDRFLTTLGVEQCRPQADPLCSVERNAWLLEQTTSFYRRVVLPVGVFVFALFLLLLPLVARRSAAGTAA